MRDFKKMPTVKMMNYDRCGEYMTYYHHLEFHERWRRSVIDGSEFGIDVIQQLDNSIPNLQNVILMDIRHISQVLNGINSVNHCLSVALKIGNRNGTTLLSEH